MKTKIIKMKKIKIGCSKVCMNQFGNPDFFKCGEIVRGKMVLCNACLRKSNEFKEEEIK